MGQFLGISARSSKLYPFISAKDLAVVVVTGPSRKKPSKSVMPVKSRHRNTLMGTELVTREVLGTKILVAVSYEKNIIEMSLPRPNAKR